MSARSVPAKIGYLSLARRCQATYAPFCSPRHIIHRFDWCGRVRARADKWGGGRVDVRALCEHGCHVRVTRQAIYMDEPPSCIREWSARPCMS